MVLTDIEKELVELIAKAIYCDSYTQYGTCSPDKWKKTTETQRAFCRSQATVVINLLVDRGSILK